MRTSRSFLWVMLVVFGLAAATAVGSSTISVSLVNPGSDTVWAGEPVTLEVRATYNTRLSAIAFRISAAGAAGLSVTNRSLDPTGPNGLTYVSPISQGPFVSGLPHDLKASPLMEAAFDADYGVAPGGVLDGLAPGAYVLIEEVVVVTSGSGSVTVSLSDVGAVHTTGPVNGGLFDVAGVGDGSVILINRMLGDGNVDYDVDLVDHGQLIGCLTGPDRGPVGTECRAYDFEPDNDVDLRDVAGFQQVFTGMQ